MPDQDELRMSIEGAIVDTESGEFSCPSCAGRLPELEDAVAWVRKYLHERNVRAPLMGPHGSRPLVGIAYRNEHTCPHCSSRMAVIVAALPPGSADLFRSTE